MANFAAANKVSHFYIMEWLINVFASTESVAHIAILYALVIAVGVLLVTSV